MNGDALKKTAGERILILDGAMGSMIQAWRSPDGAPLGEADFRGSRFADHPVQLQGCNELLCLTKPEVVYGIHEAYLRAGADIIETCSMNSTEISLKDYGLNGLAYEIGRAAAALARKAADSYSSPEKPRFAAGSIGPTSRGASYTADIDSPGLRGVTWDQLEAAYYDNARGLLDGGADLLIIETIFDALNAKAALFAVKRLERERNIHVPVIVSASISEAGRLLTGQTVEAFCAAILDAEPLALGLNCSFGAAAMKDHLAKLAGVAPCMTCAYPNAGLPDRRGRYGETPELMAAACEAFMKEGLVNIIGGCCGSTPAHIAAIAKKSNDYKPRKLPAFGNHILLSGAQAAEFDALELSELSASSAAGEALFSPAFSPSGAWQKAVDAGAWQEAADLARDRAAGARLLPLRPDKAPDPVTFARNFIFVANCFSEISALPLYIESSRWEVIESALKSCQGRGVVKYSGLKKSDSEYKEKAKLAACYGALLV